jgi:hypothetical protein
MQQIVDFILELDKLKAVTRKVKPLGVDRYENSAEHSWQIALMAASLAGYAESYRISPITVELVSSIPRSQVPKCEGPGAPKTLYQREKCFRKRDRRTRSTSATVRRI